MIKFGVKASVICFALILFYIQDAFAGGATKCFDIA